MLSYPKVQNKPRVLQSLTGLRVSEFEQLWVSFERAWQDYIRATSHPDPQSQTLWWGTQGTIAG